MAVREEEKPERSRLARLRRERKLTQAKLAELASVDLRTLKRLENNELAEPRLRPYARLAEALECSVDELIEPEWRRPR